jgi:anti-sigma regulatory factor (Ser/Thr protein kinase)
MDSALSSQATAETWGYSCALPADPQSVWKARTFVRFYLIEYRLPHLVDSVRLVASELATNAVVHAQTPSRLTLSHSGSAVRLELTDGSGHPPTRRPASPAQTLETGGYGLGLLDALSLEWGVITDFNRSKTVWASFDADPCGHSATETGSLRERSPRTS